MYISSNSILSTSLGSIDAKNSSISFSFEFIFAPSSSMLANTGTDLEHIKELLMNIVVLVYPVAALIQAYPLTRIFRFLLYKLGVYSKQNMVISLVLTFLFDIIYWFSFSSNNNARFLELIISDLLALIWIYIIDISRDNNNSLNKLLSHALYRIPASILTTIFLMISLHIILRRFGWADNYYIAPLFISIFYSYFVFRKKSILDKYKNIKSATVTF